MEMEEMEKRIKTLESCLKDLADLYTYKVGIVPTYAYEVLDNKRSTAFDPDFVPKNTIISGTK